MTPHLPTYLQCGFALDYLCSVYPEASRSFLRSFPSPKLARLHGAPAAADPRARAGRLSTERDIDGRSEAVARSLPTPEMNSLLSFINEHARTHADRLASPSTARLPHLAHPSHPLELKCIQCFRSSPDSINIMESRRQPRSAGSPSKRSEIECYPDKCVDPPISGRTTSEIEGNVCAFPVAGLSPHGGRGGRLADHP